MAKIIAIINQKGGCAKSTTTIHLGVGLAKRGKRVLLVDADPQASMTVALGMKKPDELALTLTTLLNLIAQDEEYQAGLGIYQCGGNDAAGYDMIPTNIALSAFESQMVNLIGRERLLEQLLAPLREQYDYILIDNMPSLGMLTINTLTAADSIIIPVQPEYLSAIGMTQLLQTVGRVRKQLNPGLQIDGVLISMADMRSNHAKEAVSTIRSAYGQKLRVFDTQIPMGVKVREASAQGVSVFALAPRSKVALAYDKLVGEVLAIE